jgi:hypothetical protein
MPYCNFRVVIPTGAEKLTTMAERIIVKHEAEGVNSPLNLINMSEMKDLTLLARAKDSEAITLTADKEIAFQQRDNTIGLGGEEKTVIYYVKSSRDILMGYYKGSETMLGDHGFEIRQKKGHIKVGIPSNVGKIIELAGLILAKHAADGANSPIKGLDIADFTDKYNYALAQHELATKLNRDKIACFAERNRLLGIGTKQLTTTRGTVRFYMTSARDILLGLYKGSEVELDLWGFNYHDRKRHKHQEVLPDAEPPT